MNMPEIGRVVWGRDGSNVATLLGVDLWRVTVGGQDVPELARTFATHYRGSYAGPQDGYYGQAILRDLAALSGGTAEFGPLPEPETGAAS